jgi:hypothetical protein
MKIPIWVWDKRQKKYLRLPPGLQQFHDGKWGFPSVPWPNQEMVDFYDNHRYLFRLEPGDILHYWRRAVLKKPGPDKYQPRKDKARITKVQR